MRLNDYNSDKALLTKNSNFAKSPSILSSYFQYFKTPTNHIELPSKFTFPFYYEPHPLSKIAAKEVQSYLEEQTDFEHNFGINPKEKGPIIGKMFGVLVVQNRSEKIGYIAAVSGKLANKNNHKLFVPPVYNMLAKDSHFLKEEKILNQLNKELEQLESDQEFKTIKETHKRIKKEAAIDINLRKKEAKEAKKQRDYRRKTAVNDEKNMNSLEKTLAQESLESKYFMNNVLRYWEHKRNAIEKELRVFTDKIEALKERRAKSSAKLQSHLFEQYQFLNIKKEVKNLTDLFVDSNLTPPAGSGECAAPKLLQHAFLNDLKPIAMAEFWWGEAPTKEIRKHQQFYPACQGKCKPILTHMLDGIELDTNPMLTNPAIGKTLEIIYEDNDLIVVNKPEEFLSVPGIHIQDSVYTRIKQETPGITGPIIVHRLDMSTSGLLVLAKHKKSHKHLQQQFINKTVKKRYTALLEGTLKTDKGSIDLPLRIDLNDRPRQLVCFEHGKSATTNWEIIEHKNNQTKVHLYPISGRTHQLRVHCSHKAGLNTPILGDDLYGKKGTRLHLHADTLEFLHPSTLKTIKFFKKAAF